MKFAATAMLLMPIATQACATYQFCHCMNNDGVPNYSATKQICDGLGPSKGSMQGPSWQSSADECRAADGKSLDNCSWRQWCKLAGATGTDSWCRQKQT
ncbi:hypothetical protein GMOD_00002688 [Pyrenophora seminiperda CCB06]|uniref:Uncharacterized protein n=1 Tax=Pyrenophora seminiperda CCB06 TaxID=1302712 RepID=A0A3M7M360_9PLEO|nr:hypothetical protein GMOD_00002688 [Pyrenophora seminiperda CCB06]